LQTNAKVVPKQIKYYIINFRKIRYFIIIIVVVVVIARLYFTLTFIIKSVQRLNITYHFTVYVEA